MMRRLALLLALLALAACRHAPPPAITVVPGHGAISIEVVPNPIVARPISGNTFEFPFDVVVRETGGSAVEITRISVTVFGPGGFAVGRDAWTAEQIRAMGYSTSIGPRSETRLRLRQRKEVPSARLLSSVTAELKVEATDESAASMSATTAVTVRSDL